ncbi:MAG: serine--tRNA ligase [Clostridia bacterium]
MLDMKFIREHPDRVKDAIVAKGEGDVDVDQLLEVDARWRSYLAELERLRAVRNETSKTIGRRKRDGEDAEEMIARMREVNEEIDLLEERTQLLQRKIDDSLALIPNIPHPDVPRGDGEEDNLEIDRWGKPREFSFEPQAHWDLGVSLGILDFERGTRIAGARFSILRGTGALLERALICYMMDLHVQEHGYEEVIPPYLVNRESMFGTGQLPKFEDDAFLVNRQDYFLVPTAEVPVTNMYRGEMMSGEDLPMRFVAYSACFRAEAGAAGRDTRGLIRQHQFNKVELVQYTLPEQSYDTLEEMRGQAEKVLQRLEIPYRVLKMCTGDMGFAQSKKYDLEIWMPSYQDYVEISSISNFEDFQARRADLRFRREKDSRPEFVHTLNASGLAVGRTAASIIENYQNEDGSVTVPEPLRPYMRNLETIGRAKD